MNLPNKLSILRILFIPFVLLFMLPVHFFSFEPQSWNVFILDMGRVVAGVLFILASLTDFADGKIARKYNLITNLGKFLDSLADKMLVISVLVALVDIRRISSVFVAIIVLREFAVTGIRLLASEKGVVMAAAMIGKIKTVTQMVAIIYILFEPLFVKIIMQILTRSSLDDVQSVVINIGNVFFLVSVVMTIISGMDYLIKNKHYLTQGEK
ncbi:MAG: CDP-diacylglycerol--glycerol-3-phosphate 3-phosphatidyltransferase [Clostridiaceae bacterium]|nr:CDP-diacylglycerol--glycerol-3-phosphate 3-phosphatidyltransferase [Clostridiaceae bacterium]